MQKAVRHFDEVAENLVVADLERVDASSGAFFGLNPGNRVLPPVAQCSPFVQSAVEPVTHAGIITNRDWRSLDEGTDDFVPEILAVIPRVDMRNECSVAFG